MNDPKQILVPCFLCGGGTELKYSKREKPYLICDPCGIQIFVRGKKGIALLSKLCNSLKSKTIAPAGQNNLEINTLANRLAELRMLSEKAEEGNWLNCLFSDKQDPIQETIRAEIAKIESRLEQIANN